MGYKNKAYENGNAFSHKDSTLVIAGVELPSCTNFSITKNSGVTQNMGMGIEPISYGREGATTEGSFEIDQKDLNKLRVFSPTGLITDCPPLSGHILQENETGDKNGFSWTTMIFENDGIETATGNTQTLFTVNFKAVNLTKMFI